MKSEHRNTYDENSAFSGWRRFVSMKPKTRAKIKRLSHHIDRRQAQREIRKDMQR